jgi:DedD protein
MSDEGFHEIQLNGKQLVFLFMAATVVAVVIFLCGVMVGRGAPTRATVTADFSEQAGLDPTAPLQEPATQPIATDGSVPLTAQETLTYPTLLENPNPPVETLAPAPQREPIPSPIVPVKPAAVSPKPPTASAPRPVATRTTPVAVPERPAIPESAPAREPAAQASLDEPPGDGFVVQVAAVRQRAEANTIARRLSNKGYQAFVTTSGVNFRVRVGKFDDRREAQSVAGRLEREENFKPWVTR